MAPFTLTVHTRAYDFFKNEDTLPVILEHFFKKRLLIDTSCSLFTIRFDKDSDSGIHNLKFTTKSDYGTIASCQINVDIKLRRQPKILSARLYPDTIELDPWLAMRPVVYFYTTIYDPDHLADSIFVKIGPVFYPSPAHPLEAGKDTLYDTSFFSFSETKEKIKQFYKDLIFPIPIVVKDIFGRESRFSITLTFSEKRLLRGFPPRIDSIYIINKPDIVTVGEQICFGIKAIDYPDQGSTPKDTSLLMFDWDFGDGTVTTKKYPCNTYSNEGEYIVRAVVTDDSGNTDTATMSLKVLPSNIKKPLFTRFSVQTKTTVAPCTLYISVEGRDMDGYIKSLLLYVKGEKVDIDTNFTSITDWPYFVTHGDNYNIIAILFDNDGNYHDTSYSVIITDRQNTNTP